jgi:hypothetical protein
VDVLAAAEGLAQELLAREVREDAQLHLRVVDREQPVTRGGHERRAQLAAERRANGDVLQVRALRREAAGGGRDLRERRVQAAVLPEQLGEGQQVGREQLRELAPLLDDRHDRVQVAKLGEHLRVGRVARLPAPSGRQLEALEQHLAELLGGSQHERPARQLVRPLLELLDLLRDPGGDLAHARRVDCDAGALHRAQHRHERQLDVLEQRAELPFRDARGQRLVQQQAAGRAPGEHGIVLGGSATARPSGDGHQVVLARPGRQIGRQLDIEAVTPASANAPPNV